MGKFESGRTKTGGRALGTVNKNANLKDKIRDYLLEKFEIYAATLDMLAVEDQGTYVKEYREMVKYVIPAISPVPYESDNKITTAQVHLRKLTGYDDGEKEQPEQQTMPAQGAGTPNGAGAPSSTGTRKKSVKETLTKIKKDERDKTDKSE